MTATVAIPEKTSALDVEKIRRDFPILHTQARGHNLVYLDNAATSQKPQAVIDALVCYYESGNANIHRGVHYLSEKATQEFEEGRATVQRFVNAANPGEIVFARGTTEAINLVAQTWGRANIRHGDEIVVSAMEHHSNIVPWQIVCEQQGANLRVAPVNDAGELIFAEFEKLLGRKTKLVAMAHVSNALGTVNPVAKIVEAAHRVNARVLLDGAQAVPHMSVDVCAIDCDFYAFSGHKIYGPTGIGILYGKAELLDAMPPYQGGGDMISSVTFEKTLYNRVPQKFEAGTPHVSGSIGLGAALQYVNAIGIDRIARHEKQILAYGTRRLQEIPGLRLIGTAQEKEGILSFVLEGIHPHDIGTVLDQEGIAIRTGHHCAQPLMERFGVPATARASLALYNTMEEIDALANGLQKVREVFA